MSAVSGAVTFYDFDYFSHRGYEPIAGLVLTRTGSLLGTTGYGGTAGHGTVFKVDLDSGQRASLVEFDDSSSPKKGALPYAGLVSDGGGYFWGSTRQGGKGYGTLFKIDAVGGPLATQSEFTYDGESDRGAETAS